MPLNKISIDSVLGLNTERNDTSGINAPAWSAMGAWALENASSGATSPNTLLDCSNIIISRNKQAAARTAFTEVWDFSATYGKVVGFSTSGLYAIPNSNTNSLQIAWSSTTTINSFFANIGNFTTSSHQNMASTVNFIAGSESTLAIGGFTNKFQLLPDFSWQTMSMSPLPFPIKSFNLGRFSTSYNNIYIFSSNGVFRTITNYISDTTSSSFNKYKRVTLPLVINLSGAITASPANASRWLQSGYYVDIKIVAFDQISGTQVYQGKPSRTLTVINSGAVSSVQVTFKIDNTNLDVTKASIAVYRTISYLPGAVPPTDFYRCYEAALNSAMSVSDNVSTFTSIELTLNDTSIQQFEKIYISIDRESLQNPPTSAESSAPPAARDVVSYNNYTIYGNVMGVPFAPLTMIALPNTDNLDLLQIGATANIPITYVPNSTTTPAHTGVISTVTGTFTGATNNPNVSSNYLSGNGYFIVIRPQNPNGTSATGSYSVPYYAIADSLVPNGGAGATSDIRVTPDPGNGVPFDITQFPATGIVAVIQSATTGYVVAIFSYQSYEQDTAAGYYTFKDCLAFGAEFSSATWGAGGLQTAGAYVLYSIPGTNVLSLSLYAIGSDAAGYTDDVGFSLLPVYEVYPTRRFNQNLVGRLNSVRQVTPATLWDPVLATIDFAGVYAQTAGQLLMQSVRTLCDTFNLARTPEDPYAVYDDAPTAPVGRIRFESIYCGYNRKSAYTTNTTYTSGNGFYDQITARVYRASGSPAVKFAEPVTSTQLNIMQQSVQTIAGITISKFNKPEEIPVGQNLTPFVVGDPLKPIIKLENQYNQLLVFKQNEGTYRLDLAKNSAALPQVSILTLIDNTAWLLLPESVQTFEGSVVFFSNKSFVSISPAGQISEISNTIATELLNAYNRIFENGTTDSVRSWIIAQQRLYCCHFPNVNDNNTSITYVFSFNTGQWTKWSGEIIDTTVSSTGEVSLVENIYELETDVTNETELQAASLALNNKYWTVLRQANFQDPSNSQIEDTIILTDFTVTYNISDMTITISNFGTSDVYDNLYKILMLFKDRTIWYFFENEGYRITKLHNTVVDTSITLQLYELDGNKLKVATGFPETPSVNDQIVATVGVRIFFNKFFISQPRGAILSHFNEVQIYTQEYELYSFLQVGFNSFSEGGDIVITTSGAIVTTNDGDYVTISTDLDEIFAPFFILGRSAYVFRVLVPRDSGRGRFIQIGLKHDTPDEVFKLNSLVYIYRDSTSFKIKSNL